MKHKDLWSLNIYSMVGGTRYELVFTSEDRAVACYDRFKQVLGTWKRLYPTFIHYRDDFNVEVSIVPKLINTLYFVKLTDAHRRATDVGDTQHVIAEAYESDINVQFGFEVENKVDKKDE